jgi:hypothetical protein
MRRVCEAKGDEVTELEKPHEKELHILYPEY